MQKFWRLKGAIPALILVAIALIQAAKKPPSSSSDNPCPQHLPDGMPTGTPASNDLIVRDIYCLSSNDQTKFADWVAYRLDRKTITGSDDQDRDWQADPVIDPAATLEPDDYDGAHKALDTDRGHLAPLASFRGKEWQQVNYLSNIAPQASVLNRGAWRELEEYVRDQVGKYGEVFVITGTAYHQRMAQLPEADEQHMVPSGFWKVITVKGRTEAYFFEQSTQPEADFGMGKIDLFELERLTGLDFP